MTHEILIHRRRRRRRLRPVPIPRRHLDLLQLVPLRREPERMEYPWRRELDGADVAGGDGADGVKKGGVRKVLVRSVKREVGRRRVSRFELGSSRCLSRLRNKTRTYGGRESR